MHRPVLQAAAHLQRGLPAVAAVTVSAVQRTEEEVIAGAVVNEIDLHSAHVRFAPSSCATISTPIAAQRVVLVHVHQNVVNLQAVGLSVARLEGHCQLLIWLL